MSQGRERDWSVTAGWSVRHLAELPARLARLGLLGSVLGGLAVDQLAHSPLRRAERAGKGGGYVSGALVNEIDDALGPADHAEIASAAVKAFASGAEQLDR